MSSIIRILLIFYKNVSKERYIKELFDEIIPKRRCFKITIDGRVVPFSPVKEKKTLREILIALGANLPGLTTDRGFNINGHPYSVERVTKPDSRLSWTVDTHQHTLTISNPTSEDEVHRVMFEALLQYTPEKADSPFYQYLVELKVRITQYTQDLEAA